MSVDAKQPAPERWYSRTVPPGLYWTAVACLVALVSALLSPLTFLPGQAVVRLVFWDMAWRGTLPQVAASWAVGTSLWVVSFFLSYRLARILVLR